LKHMVEDKWQARGQGRKEKITHQPTGGRGAQGGLKIGEMDRDAIIGHSLAAFQRESFMKRSDSSKIQICTGCGTVPIFNPSKKSKININQCTLCNGPPNFIGSTNHNIEILPLMKRQKGRIVTVELPYATNVLMQELASIANIGLRLITTGDTARLRPMEVKGELTEDMLEEAKKPLKPINLPEPFNVERTEGKEEDTQTDVPVLVPASDAVVEGAEALQTEGAERNNPDLTQEGIAAQGMVAPVPSGTGVPVPVSVPSGNVVPGNVAPSGNGSQDLVVQLNKQEGGGMTLMIQQPRQQQQQPQQQQSEMKNVIVYPAQTQVFPPSMPGASPRIAIQGGAPPPPILSIDTSQEAMMADGLMPQMMPTRRNNPFSQQQQPQQVQQSNHSTGAIMVNKLG